MEAVGDRLYVTFSQGGNILYSDDPFDPGSWVNIGRPYEWHDPAFLYDDDGYLYVYEGLGDKCLHASRLDPDNNMRLLEGPVPIFYSDYKNRGYDRCGDNGFSYKYTLEVSENGVSYYVIVDAYNRNGITYGKTAKKV